MNSSPRLSVVIPVFNERESLSTLCQQLAEALEGESYEVVFVDDGSTDGSGELLEELVAQDHHLQLVRFTRNFGKSAALEAGLRESRGEIVITMDGDLQDDPAEIPRLVAAIDQGFDLVSGWKVKRQDPLSKKLPSLLFNAVTAWLTGIPLHDFNSGFKAYRRPLVERLCLYGEQHRFIPALACWYGFRVTEVGVRHRARPFGRSKFGPKRFLSGFLDLFTVLFLTRFSFKPLHLFGTMGLISFLAGGAINLYLTLLWLSGERIGTRPLLQLGVLLMVVGVQLFSMGLLGEMIALTWARQGGPAYRVIASHRGRGRTFPDGAAVAAGSDPSCVRSEAPASNAYVEAEKS